MPGMMPRMVQLGFISCILTFAQGSTGNSTDNMSLATKFHDDGFAFPIPVFTDTEVHKIRTFLDGLEAHFPNGQFPAQLMNPHLEHREVWNFLRRPAHTAAAAAVSGKPSEQLRILGVAIMTKYPTPIGEVPTGTVGWHQDLAYWNLEPQEAFTTWVAIDNVTEENGCMHMVPQRHQLGMLEHRVQGESSDNVLMNKQAIPEVVLGNNSRVCVELSSGEISAHTGWTPHTSRPNRMQQRRMGISVHWIPSHVHVGPSLYDTKKDDEWRLPVDPNDDTFPPQVLLTPNSVIRETITSEL